MKNRLKMNPVIQQEISGCAIASSAALAGISYEEAKTAANRMGIYAEDPLLWSDTSYIRRLLESFGISAGLEQIRLGIVARLCFAFNQMAS